MGCASCPLAFGLGYMICLSKLVVAEVKVLVLSPSLKRVCPFSACPPILLSSLILLLFLQSGLQNRPEIARLGP